MSAIAWGAFLFFVGIGRGGSYCFLQFLGVGRGSSYCFLLFLGVGRGGSYRCPDCLSDVMT
jgi:hypothetical protein